MSFQKMPEIVTKDVAEPNDTEKDKDENEDEEEPQLDKDKKHNSGAADLEKVTDYAEDQEILSTGNELEDAIVAIRNKQAQKTAEKLARERELAKVVISKEHVELIMHEMELPKKRLKEH
eukprot:TRINITY_DN18144_c0_g1_i1.p1 TRINITY_DN18144_c0_g1~~TRINITY_DN18144_c0_g1_i1.p1  ORF type:complete len:120 (-),score=65.94 TRINITY_DN18144_c0_g1_i1:74-433(-)